MVLVRLLQIGAKDLTVYWTITWGDPLNLLLLPHNTALWSRGWRGEVSQILQLLLTILYVETIDSVLLFAHLER